MRKSLILRMVILVSFATIWANCSNSTGVEEASDEILFIPKSAVEDGKNKSPKGTKESPYACHVSTLANEKADYNYWNTSFWVHIPEGLAKQAEGRTVLKSFVYGDEHAGDKARSFRGEPKVVRVVQCLLPDNEKVFERLEKKFKKFGKNSWADSDTVKKAMNIKQKGEWVCSQFFITEVCSYNSQTGNWDLCTVTDIRCIEWTFVMEEDDFPNGGGSGGPSDNPGDCDPNELDPCFDEGDGNSGPPPTNTDDPCEVANPPVWCSCNDTGDPNLDNRGMREIIYEVFGNSNTTELDQHNRTEQGGWIIKNPTTGKYKFEAIDWPRNHSKMIYPQPVPVPANTVGFLHTHPYSIGEKMYAFAGLSMNTYNQFKSLYEGAVLTYNGIASNEDIKFIKQVNAASTGNNILGYVVDKDGIRKFDKNTEFSSQEDINRIPRSCY